MLYRSPIDVMVSCEAREIYYSPMVMSQSFSESVSLGCNFPTTSKLPSPLSETGRL